MATRLQRARGAKASLVKKVAREALTPDATNPRKSDAARLGLLRLSLAKLGFIMPVFADSKTGLLLSGHQRLKVSGELGIAQVPVIYIDVKPEDVKGINVLFNRATNDFTAFDTGSKAHGKLDLDTVIAEAEELDDCGHDAFFAYNCEERDIRGFMQDAGAERYDKKAAVLADSMLRMGIRIPLVVSKSGKVINGIHRGFAALEAGETSYPVITVSDEHASVALNFLNYLSMDFHIDDEFKNLILHSAYRRPQNNRGAVPKAMRFWANGHRTLPDKDSYSIDYWRQFRDIHGYTVLDFGAGLGKAAPYLQGKDIRALDFEPFRIDPEGDVGVPSPAYSKQQARRFLDQVADPKLKFDSIFLCSVLNSVPLPEYRLAVLAIVHALSTRATGIYGTCRDISDYNYEYGGIRNANYFTFDSEPGVRVGDVMRAPKIQKFHSQDEARVMFEKFWKGVEFWPGGNVFYFKLTSPKGINIDVLGKALELEFDLPYADGTRMGLVERAKEAFSKRLMTGIK